MENVVPCCFQNFIRPNVDLNDAQQVLVSILLSTFAIKTCFLSFLLKVFNEIGQCLNLLHSKFGDDFLKYLEITYLPTLQLNPQIIQVIFGFSFLKYKYQ